MKRKKFDMEWFVYIHGINCNEFRKMNIFNHLRFEEYTIKHLKECSTKVEFAEKISREFSCYSNRGDGLLIMTKRITYPSIDMKQTGRRLKHLIESAGYTPRMIQG